MAHRTYRFGAFELSEARSELRRGSAAVPLQPKVADLLLYLLRHRERVVPKDELLSALWPDVVVTAASLSRAVAGARRALGERAGEDRHIRTVRGRGFQFVAAVTEADPAAVAATATDFVGREDILAAVRDALAAAQDGTGRLLLLGGDPGMGKTRTAGEAAAHARAAGAQVLSGWCTEGEGAPELWPWIRPLRQVLAAVDLGPLLRGLGDGVADLAELVPALGAHRDERRRRARPDPEQARLRLFETIVEVLRQAAQARPLLLVLDDFHWADRGSLALLGVLARSLETARMAVLVTYREAAAPLMELGRHPGVVGLVLTGLGRDQVARLVESETGEAVDERVAAAIHERTEGNPFFVKELARALQTLGRLDSPASLDGLRLPAAVRDVLDERLGRLSTPCRDLLVAAALIGRDLDVSVLARVAGLDPEEVLARLDEARAARVVDRHPGGFRFAHALIREALLAPVGEAERSRLHCQIGSALEAHYQGDLAPHLAELAHHFSAGAASGAAEQALDYARRAGERASRLLAYDEAAGHYRRALEVHSLCAVPDERRRGDLLLALGEAQVAAGEPEAGRATLRRAAAAARALASPERLAHAALAMGGPPFSPVVGVEDPELVALLEEALAATPAGPLRVRLLVQLSITLIWYHAWDRIGALIREAVEVARRLGEAPIVGYALYGRRWSLLAPGELEPKLADSEEILRLARRSGDRELELAARSCRILDLVELGRVEDADLEIAAYEHLAAEVRVPRHRWRARFYRVMRLLLEGRLTDAEGSIFQALGEERRLMPGDAQLVLGAQVATLRLEQGRIGEIEPALRDFVARFPTIPAWRAALALAEVALGRVDDARRTLDALAADGFRALPTGLDRVMGLAMAAEACAAVGDAAHAAELYALLRPCVPRTLVMGNGAACWGALARVLGLLATTTGDWEAAERHFAEALVMNTRIGARPFVGWTEYGWAAMLCRRGRPGDCAAARARLGRARAIAEGLGMVRLATQTAELEARLGGD